MITIWPTISRRQDSLNVAADLSYKSCMQSRTVCNETILCITSTTRPGPFSNCSIEVSYPGHTSSLQQQHSTGLGSTPSLAGSFLRLRVISGVCLENSISDWQEGLTVTSIICDHWWNLELVLLHPLEFRGNYSAASINIKLVHWPLMGGLLQLVQRGRNMARP